MRICPWEEISGFQHMYEFNRFLEWMNEQVREKIAEEIAVQQPFTGKNAFRESWYRHAQTGEVWRLVWPDEPFTGLFRKVV
jgi:hypothetical protein